MAGLAIQLKNMLAFSHALATLRGFKLLYASALFFDQM
jgi:hypothetical protein